jgi:hypothetical protein
MTNWRASVSYNTSKNSASPLAYDLTLCATENPISPIVQHGPVWDNIAINIGVYATKREAVEAIMSQIEANGRLVEIVTWGADTGTVAFWPLDKSIKDGDGYSIDVLAIRTPHAMKVF